MLLIVDTIIPPPCVQMVAALDAVGRWNDGEHDACIVLEEKEID